MSPDGWHLTEDVDDFLARAGDFLRSRPVLHTVPLTVTEALSTRGADAYGDDAPSSACWSGRARSARPSSVPRPVG